MTYYLDRMYPQKITISQSPCIQKKSSHYQCGSSPRKTMLSPIQWQAIGCIRTDPLGGVSCDHGLDGMLCVSTWSMLIRTMGDIVWVTLVHYKDVTMSAMASQITSLTIVYSTVYWGADQRKQQCPASLVFVLAIYFLPLLFLCSSLYVRIQFILS